MYPPGVRPGGATAAAVLLFVVGGVVLLYSLLGLSQVGAISDLVGGVEGAGIFVGVFTGVMVILLILAILQLLAGGWTLSLRSRGRSLGLLASTMIVVLWLLILILGISQGTADALGILVGLVAIGGGITIVALLVQTSGAFARR